MQASDVTIMQPVCSASQVMEDRETWQMSFIRCQADISMGDSNPACGCREHSFPRGPVLSSWSSGIMLICRRNLSCISISPESLG